MENKYITFEDYLRNQLKENEANDFLKSLDDNPVLRKEFEDYKFLRENLVRKFNVKTDKQLLAHLERYGDKYFKGKDSKVIAVPKIRNINRLLYSVAASLLLLCAVVFGLRWQFDSTHSPEVLAKNSQIQLVELYKSTNDENGSESVNSLKTYNGLLAKQNYKQVVDSYSELNIEASEQRYADLIYAEALLQSGNLAQAIAILDNLMESEDLKLKHKAEFNYARVLLMIGDEEKAVKMLKNISLDRVNNNHASDATLLLEKLSDFRYKVVTLF